jgi:gamma-glutamyltranspeptidase / glutathione hydrolase
MNQNIIRAENSFSPSSDGKCAIAGKAMVSTASKASTLAGIEILKKGGNAVDAAVAAAVTLGVSEPQGSGMGGQTMMLLSFKGRTIAIDGSSRAPSLAHVSAITNEDRTVGYRATTVPSTPATLAFVQKKYGNLQWSEVLEPAINLAEEGYPITQLQHKWQNKILPDFDRVPSRSGSKYFLKDNMPYEAGDIFRQPELAAMIKRLAKEGVEEFYNGKTAKMIDADMRENGGLLRYDDLVLLPWPLERRPLTGYFRGLRIDTMPPPGAGKPLLLALSMLDFVPSRFDFGEEFKKDLLLIHILRKALLQREGKPYHPIFAPFTDEDKNMFSKRYIKTTMDKILDKLEITLLPVVPTPDEQSGETTHLSIIDKDGMAVSLTQSIERVYGSKAAAAGLGFLYNNYISDFEYEKPEHPYYLRPNHVPWATVSPSLIYLNDEIWMAVGSPGSERVLSTITQFLLNVTEFGMSIDESMKAPRLHVSLGGQVSLEAERFPEGLTVYLEKKGYRINELDPYSFYLGSLHAALKTKNGALQGIADIRRDGFAAGI